MKEIAVSISIFAIITVLYASPALSQQPFISPERIKFDVPYAGSTKVKLTVYNFEGNLEIGLQDMGLMTVYPKNPEVVATFEGTPLELTFYGARS